MCARASAFVCVCTGISARVDLDAGTMRDGISLDLCVSPHISTCLGIAACIHVSLCCSVVLCAFQRLPRLSPSLVNTGDEMRANLENRLTVYNISSDSRWRVTARLLNS